jgi:hypothetical protein
MTRLRRLLRRGRKPRWFEAFTSHAVDFSRSGLVAAQAFCQGFYHCAVGVIVFEGPEHGAAKAAGDAEIYVEGFCPGNRWIVEGPEGEGCGVVDPLRDSFGIVVLLESGETFQGQERSYSVGFESIAGG